MLVAFCLGLSAAEAASLSGTVVYSGPGQGPIKLRLTRPKAIPNQALQLDGVDSCMAVPLSNLPGTNAFTIQYWFRGSSSQSAFRQQGPRGWIISGWNEIHALSFDGGMAGLSVGPRINDGQWHQVTLTWRRNDPTGFASYLDGRLVATRRSVDRPVPQLDSFIYIGAREGKSEFTKGTLDEINLWDRWFSPAEVAARWNVSATGTEDGLVASWNFDGGESKDSGPGGLDGILFGGAFILNAPEVPALAESIELTLSSPGAFRFDDLTPSDDYQLTAFISAPGLVQDPGAPPLASYTSPRFKIETDRQLDPITLADSPRILELSENVAAEYGDTVRLAVVAGGSAPLSVQWLLNGVPLFDDGRFTGSSTLQLNISPFKPGDEGFYSLHVQNGAGETLSDTILLTHREPLSTGLLGYWPFNESAGDQALDSSSFGNPAELRKYSPSAIRWVPGRIGNALTLGGPGTGQYVRVADYPKVEFQMSVSLWVRAESALSWGSILNNWTRNKAGQFHLGFDGDSGRLALYVTLANGSTPQLIDNAPLTLQAWHHVVFIADGLNLHLFRDGVEVDVKPYSGFLSHDYVGPMGIGVLLDEEGTQPDTLNPGYWDGGIDELTIWGRSLSSAEIRGIYEAGLLGKPWTESKPLPEAPVLFLEMQAGQVFLRWSDPTRVFRLETCDSLNTSPWMPVDGVPAFSRGTAQQAFPIRDGSQYFRLIQQR